VEDFSVDAVEENGFVRAIAGDKDMVAASRVGDAKAGWIGDLFEFVAAEFALGNLSARSKRDEAFRSDDSAGKGVDDNAVAETSWPLAEWVGQ